MNNLEFFQYHFSAANACTRFSSNNAQSAPESQQDESVLELEPMKLPGKLGDYTGNVMYPNDESAVWDINGAVDLFSK